MPSQGHKFKVLHIITGLGTGGAEMMLFKLLSRMDRECYAPEVISLTDIGPVGTKIRELGVPVHGIEFRIGRPDPFLIWRFIQIVRKAHPDLIQGWMYHGNLAAQFVNNFLPNPVPIFWNVRHSVYNLDYEKRTTAWMIRLCAKLSGKPAKILYNSRVSASQHEALGYVPEKRVMIPNGFDTDVFSPSEESRVDIRKELGLPASATLIGLFGRYHPMKDHDVFIRAAANISETHPELHFLLAGTNVDVKNPELTKLIDHLELKANFHLLGERKDINRLTASLDIATSSSFFGEGFPNVIGEAMSCGVPCLVTDVGDSAWVVGDTGRVVPPRNPGAMASAWKEFLDMGQEGRRNLGAKARDRVINNFSIDKIVSDYETLYSSLLN